MRQIAILQSHQFYQQTSEIQKEKSHIIVPFSYANQTTLILLFIIIYPNAQPSKKGFAIFMCDLDRFNFQNIKPRDIQKR
jgi:hypothetical protein